MALISRPKKIRRLIKRRSKDALELSQQADDKIEKLLIRRFDRLISVRRFVGLWLGLAILLIFTVMLQLRSMSPYYQKLEPTPGGFYSEGLVGDFTNANPLYANGIADIAVSRLIFSGLLKYDNHNKLAGDLATSWQLSKDQKTYTVKLRHNAVWQDGQPFTADDVVYTYRMIQDPESQSPLYNNWTGINVTKVDNFTVRFNLPDSLAAFPSSLTNGIIPAHLLKSTPANQLRSALFNTNPVGTGPFRWNDVEVSGTGTVDQQQRISLAANSNYYFGRPNLDGFSLLTFTDEAHLTKAFNKKQVNSMSGLETLPNNIAKSNTQTYVTPLDSIVMAFFNNSNSVLSDSKVRLAMVRGVDRQPLVNLFNYPTNLADSPLLRGELGYRPVQQSYNLDKAKALLRQDGWHKNSHGVETKHGKTLEFTLRTQDTNNYAQVAEYLQQQWSKLGITVDVRYYDSNDLQSDIIANHDYDILLYGISIGADPDVFAYWDSSQASISSEGHLNLSEYKSSLASQSLEAGRTRSDPKLRVIKYRSFLNVWGQDAPALALYQPNFLYITHGPIYNYQRQADINIADRFYNVNTWMIRQTRQTL